MPASTDIEVDAGTPPEVCSTGYSSLACLQRFPFDRIKIDQSFVHQNGNGARPVILNFRHRELWAEFTLWGEKRTFSHQAGVYPHTEPCLTYSRLLYLQACPWDTAPRYLLRDSLSMPTSDIETASQDRYTFAPTSRHQARSVVHFAGLFCDRRSAADHVRLDRRCPHDRRNMVLGSAVSSLRRNEIQTVSDPRSANGTSTRAIPKW
jgi:hypothetical protein